MRPNRRLLRTLKRLKTAGVVQALLRGPARLRLGHSVPGSVTVVIVNWNAKPFLEVAVDAVRRFSPPGTRLLVVDNASSDGSRAWLRNQDLRRALLPLNVGHGLAMDIGFLLARTEFVVALDVDAFPVSDRWLPAVLDLLRDGAMVAGGRGPRDIVHPSFLAMRRRRFVLGRHSFVPRYAGELGADGWDVGERISIRERGRLGFLPVTFQYGPPPIGTVYGDVVYHNFYGVRHLLETDPDSALVDGLSRRDARVAYEWATRHFLGVHPSLPGS